MKFHKFGLNSFKLFGLKRKLDIFYPIEDFFDPDNYREYSPVSFGAMEVKKDKKWVKKGSRILRDLAN